MGKVLIIAWFFYGSSLYGLGVITIGFLSEDLRRRPGIREITRSESPQLEGLGDKAVAVLTEVRKFCY